MSKIKKLYTGHPDMRCPHMGGKLCEKVCPTCIHQREFDGVDPTTGEKLKGWDCELSMQTVLLMKILQTEYSTGAAIESFRNETVVQNKGLINGAAILAQQTLGGIARITAEDPPQLEGPDADA